MIYKIIISPAATENTLEAFTYYEAIQTNLGDRFISELEQSYQRLQNHPAYYSYILIEYNLRAVALKKFPYLIIYEIDNDRINVFAIHNTSRSPDHFIKRILK